MIIAKTFAAIILILLISAVAWCVTHLRKIRRTLNATDAMPEVVPGTNLVLWLAVLFVTLASLLIGFIFF